ncbi:hypothetical protein CRM22_000960 [Opisthorchis felineus]|uniref:Tetraspanin n=2 Tax=Opisthorchis felineus TaxID=147828 RepID=A0A4S2MJE3_OPIFE|nr:hypothetical protein CRM22_000960 [Opisthorchis felineus]TGZ74398.1 hypothetical protein CRM22_000960 [Opisthorchis felineus]
MGVLDRLRYGGMVERAKNWRRATLASNILLIITGFIVCISVLAMYINPRWLSLIQSINQLVNMHMKLGALILFGLLYTLAGLAALQSLKVRSTFFLGLQIIALLILTVVVVATLYGVATQWIATMPTGVSFSVQEFNPGDPNNMAMANIQNVLKCCGRESYRDYYIANEAIPINWVPFSCCNLNEHSYATCTNVSKSVYRGKLGRWIDPVPPSPDATVVPESFSYTNGCEWLIQHCLLPLLFLGFITPSLCALISCMFASIYLHFAEKEDPDFDRPINLRMFTFISGVKNERKSR